MSERKPGWYWVKWGENDWEPVRATGLGYWASYVGVHEREPDEIGPRIPTPDEPWQCVPVEADDSMRQAFNDQHDLTYNPASEREYRPIHTWKRMLAAAPKPEDS